MPKPIVVVGSIVVTAAVVIGGAFFVMNNKDDTASDNSSSNSSSSSKQSSKEAELVDPDGVYKLFSDPSITKHPEDGVKFGNGQVLTFEYDGSKTANDPDATLSYQLFYIMDNGKVAPMGGGNVEGKGGMGTYTISNKVFDSAAKGRKGFLELQGTYDAGVSDSGQISGKNVKLGMYSVTFDVSD
jgi:hypothetical protein